MKRKYISPMLVIEETEPWELMAGTGGTVETETSSNDAPDPNKDPWGQPAKSNSFFEQYTNDFEDTTEE